MVSRAGLERNSSRAKPENQERWLLTYADLITLLLAFFVMMYAISSADATKFSKLAGSMRQAFNVGLLPDRQEGSILAESVVLQSGPAMVEELLAGSQTVDLQMILSEMNWVSQQEGLADKVSFTLRPEGFAIGLYGNLLFASGRAELRPDSARLLHSIAEVLARLPNSVRIEGHTDDISPTGTGFRGNWELSAARSLAVLRHLSEVEGIDPRRMSATAFSEYQPVGPNDSPEARARNRRCEVVILYPTQTPWPRPQEETGKSHLAE